jgi:hypothetical protein
MAASMVVIRCTQKLLKRVQSSRPTARGGLRIAQSQTASTTRLGDWFAAPLNVGHQRFILLVAEHTRLPVLVPASDVRRLREHLVAALRPMLHGLGVPDAAIEPELAEMNDAAFAPTNSRSIVGTLVEFARMAEHPLQDANADLTAASLWLARTPILALNNFADDLTRARLGALSPARSGSRPAAVAAAPHAAPSAVRTFRLKVTLLDVAPPIWRRFEIPADISLEQLHAVLQIVMGWTNSHLHEFEKDGIAYGVSDREFGVQRVSEKTTRVDDVLRGQGSRLEYVYDFGDDWRHRVTLERVTDTGARAARVLEAKRACPPEDVGGTRGYQAFLEAIASPAHPERQHLLDWIGGSFDSEAYDLADVNSRLARLKLRPGAGRPGRALSPHTAADPLAAMLAKWFGPPEADAKFLRRLEAKLADAEGILNDREVRYLAEVTGRAIGLAGPSPRLPPGASPTMAEDLVRWQAVRTMCARARAERSLSTKDVARLLKVPHYRIQAAERGPGASYLLEPALRYFRFLGIESWLMKWARANPELARRARLR